MKRPYAPAGRLAGTPAVPTRVSAANWSGVLALSLILGTAIWLVVQDVRVPVPLRYDYDEGVYAATADAAVHGRRLYRDVFLSQPPAFILMVRAMFGLWGASLAAARSAVVILAALWLLALMAVLSARGSPWGGLFAVCLVLGRATFVGAAHTVEMEVPAEALGCAAVGLAAWGLRRSGSVWWVGAGLLAALAMMTKLTAVTALIPVVGASLCAPGPASRSRWLLLAAGGLLGVAVLLPVVGAAGFVDQVFTFHMTVARKLREPVGAHLAMIGQFLAAEWPLSLAALLGAWRVLAKGAALERALVAWAFADGALLAALTPLWSHHLIILMSPLALLAGVALGQRPQRPLPQLCSGARVAVSAALVLCALIYVGVGMSAADRPAPSPQLERAVQQIREAVSLDGTVLTDDPMVPFLAGRRVPDRIVDSSLTRIWAGQISENALTDLVHAKETEAVVLWRGTFREYFPHLTSAAAAVFPVVVAASPDHLLLLKRPPASHP